MRTIFHRTTLVTIVIAVVAVSAVPASAGQQPVSGSAVAAPVWLASVDLSAGGHDAVFPQVAVDPLGDATAVWYRSDGANTIVQAATRAAGGTWQAPVNLSAVGMNATFPRVAVDSQGNATAIWTRSTDVTNLVVQATSRPAGGAWQAPVDVSAVGPSLSDAQVAFDGQGNATAIWGGFDGSNYVVQAATRAAGGSWQAPHDISIAGYTSFSPRLAVASNGAATAIWELSNGANTIVQAATRPADGQWTTPVDLSTAGEDAQTPQVALDQQGDATAIWYRSNGTNTIVQAALRPAGATWQPPVDLSAAGQNAQVPQVAVDRQGNATAVWDRFNGANYILQAATRPSGGTWQSPLDLSAAGQNAASPQVAVDPQGNVIASWDEFNGTASLAQVALRPAGRTWSTPLDPTMTGESASVPDAAFDAQGNATAVWAYANGTNSIVQAAGYDAAAPQLRGVSIPASGTVGVPVSFSVSPLDVWSPVASTNWSFGDGQSATGASVSHSYSSPGSYTVVVSSADALGNAASTAASITIAPAPRVTNSFPALTSVSQTHRSWREGNGDATLARHPSHRSPIGTTFAFTLNEHARVGLVFTQTASGRRVSNRCQAPSRRNRRRPRCRRTVARGTLGDSVQEGRHQLAFQGRIGSRRLPLGTYTLTITATDPVTRQRSRPQTLGFTIVR